MIRIYIALCLFIVSVSGFSQTTFTNPLLPSGADPWSIYKDGYYYYTHTLGNRIDIWKTKNLADLKTAERKTIWTPPSNTKYSKEIWAPEIHFLQGKWYVYFAADDGKNDNHRLYVLENASADPFADTWVFKGKISDPSDKWAIDGSVFEFKKQLYMVWLVMHHQQFPNGQGLVTSQPVCDIVYRLLPCWFHTHRTTHHAPVLL